MKSYKVSDYIAEFLEVNSIDSVFEVSGGMITHLLDSISLRSYTKIISCHHEQACSFAADAIGRIKGTCGVALATSGPGATNLITGIGSAYFDSSPTVFITGQVNVNELKGERKIRQLGFQETDIVSMVKPIVKGAWQITDANNLAEILEEAFSLAMSGRPGPVLIDIPMNIQRETVHKSAPKVISKKIYVEKNNLIADFISDYSLALSRAKKPLILVGGGVHQAQEISKFRKLTELLDIPVVSSLMATDVLPFNDKLRVGFIGSYGNRWSNLAIGGADLLLVLGSRLDIRQTGADVNGFSSNKTIFHVDCEEGELNNRLTNCKVLNSNLSDFLSEAILRTYSLDENSVNNWKEEINSLRSKWADTTELEGLISGINPNKFIHALSCKCSFASAYVSDVGNHQMWAAQSLEMNSDQRHLTSGGMGAMGFALPAAIGAYFANPSKPVIVISGDGGIQLNIQELETISFHKLPIKILVLNNETLGMIRQFQDSYFEGRHQSTKVGYSAPSFAKVASAYGIDSMKISEEKEVDEAISWLTKDPLKPMLLEVMIDSKANAYPKIAFGRPITDMEPLVKPIEIEST